MSSKMIMTKDKETREALKKMGLQEISKQHGLYYFLNDTSKLSKFNKNDLKIVYTNKLTF